MTIRKTAMAFRQLRLASSTRLPDLALPCCAIHRKPVVLVSDPKSCRPTLTRPAVPCSDGSTHGECSAAGVFVSSCLRCRRDGGVLDRKKTGLFGALLTGATGYSTKLRRSPAGIFIEKLARPAPCYPAPCGWCVCGWLVLVRFSLATFACNCYPTSLSWHDEECMTFCCARCDIFSRQRFSVWAGLHCSAPAQVWCLQKLPAPLLAKMIAAYRRNASERIPIRLQMSGYVPARRNCGRPLVPRHVPHRRTTAPQKFVPDSIESSPVPCIMNCCQHAERTHLPAPRLAMVRGPVTGRQTELRVAMSIRVLLLCS
jgi:hypothetical protein